MVLALKVNDKDNVATIFAEQVQGGDAIQVRDKKGETIEVRHWRRFLTDTRLRCRILRRGRLL